MSSHADETKTGIEATEPIVPTTCSPEDLPDEELLYDLADLFKVFSDTTRIKILYALMGRELCVADIAEATATSQSAVSHQLRTLKQSHLVKFRRDGRNILYSLADGKITNWKPFGKREHLSRADKTAAGSFVMRDLVLRFYC